jgi:hypothetical protein
MSIKVRYIGNVTPYFAPAATGVIEAWRPGVAAPVTRDQAAALIALGVFEEASPTAVVSVSRALNAADDGMTLELSAAGLTLTVPAGLPQGFGCLVLPNGTTTFASSGGALLNGAVDTITRSAGDNVAVAILARVTAANSYAVTGS